ncbi:MAG: sulfatase-like hydrolase/transferase [bacterium]
MPNRLSPLLLLLACCAAGSDDEPRTGAAPDRPNVLIVISDDLASIATGTWGLDGEGLVSTPGIDALARRGVVFERALCASPFCTPSRQSFLTGRWPHAIRVTQLKSTLPKDAPTLGTVFRDAGYRTAAIGKMHWMRTRVGEVEFGFDRIAGKIEWQAQLTPEERSILDEYNRGWSRSERRGWSMSNPEGAPLPLAEESHMAPFLLEKAMAFMDEDATSPFLAFLSLGEPHAPFHFPPRLLESVDPKALSLPQVDEALQAKEVLGLATMLRSRRALKGPLTEDILRGALAAYLRSVLWMDEQLVALDRYLEASGRWEDTIVIFWSDNGYLLGERGHLGKNYPYREVVQVPLSIAAPGVPPARTGELAHAIDVFPTLCGLCGIDPPGFLQGVSLEPLLRSGTPVRDQAYTEFVGQMATLETERWKLHLGAQASAGWDQLYDLQADPGETDNRFNEADLQPVVTDLVRRMRDLLASTPPDGVLAESWVSPSRGTNPDEDVRAIRRALSLVESSRPAVAPRRGER